jgi:hypothetical protein
MDPLFRLHNAIRIEDIKVREYTPKIDTTDIGKAYSTIVASHQSTLLNLKLQATLQIQANLNELQNK